jgi:hypothetical protein
MAQPQTAPKDNKNAVKPPPNGAKDAKDAKDDKAPDVTTSAVAETPKRLAKKIFIITGEIREFANARDAEVFLNEDEDVPETFQVIKGNLVTQRQKVSLR